MKVPSVGTDAPGGLYMTSVSARHICGDWSVTFPLTGAEHMDQYVYINPNMILSSLSIIDVFEKYASGFWSVIAAACSNDTSRATPDPNTLQIGLIAKDRLSKLECQRTLSLRGGRQ